MTIEPRTDKTGKVISYRVRACIGRDHGKQIWRTCTLPRPEGMTPKKEEAEIRRQADAWEQAQRKAYEETNDAAIDMNKITFAEFVREIWWKKHVMDGSHKPTSIAFYKNLSNDIIAYFERDKKKLSKITGADVKNYIVYLQTEATTKDGEPLSQTTIVRYYQTFRNIINYAVRFDYLDEDPCQKLRVQDKPKKQKKNIDFLEPKEAQRFIKALEEEPLFWRTLETVLITCGLRRGEVIGLQWGDIDPAKMTLTVSRNITIDSSSPEKYAVGTPKSGESRTVPLPRHAYALLQQLKREQEERYQAKILPRAYIFSRAENPYKPIYPTEPTRWQSKFVKRHGLKNVSPHDLRHTAASLAVEAGASLKAVQLLLGHQDSATTMDFYAGITEQAQRRTVEGTETLLYANEK